MSSNTKAAALYARAVNKASDNTNSVEIQLERLKKYAADNGFTETVIYSDIGTNKTAEDRKGLSRMIADIENGIIGTVIITDFTRFGRLNTLGMDLVGELFPKYGVQYIETGK